MHAAARYGQLHILRELFENMNADIFKVLPVSYLYTLFIEGL